MGDEMALAQYENMIRADKANDKEFFTNYLAQIGIPEPENFLAEISSDLTSDEVQAMYRDPDVYYGLA